MELAFLLPVCPDLQIRQRSSIPPGRNASCIWFLDGLTILSLEDYLFRVHTTVLCRHSTYFLGYLRELVDSWWAGSLWFGRMHLSRLGPSTNISCRFSFVAEHLYHDV